MTSDSTDLQIAFEAYTLGPCAHSIRSLLELLELLGLLELLASLSESRYPS
jgi:hypothetical protein